MKYPYENEFFAYCKNEKKYTDRTMLIVTKSVASFWNYYQNGADDATLDNIQATDIQNYLNSLETNLGMKKNTINKYISHLKVYFTFLYSHHLIKNYPVIEINGRRFNRKHIYVINWMDKLPQIAQIDGIHPETVKMMLAIALGYLPDEVLKLRYSDVYSKINSYELRQYLKKHTNFTNGDDPYILGKKFGGYYASDFHLSRRAEPDRKLIGMDITLQNLRLSFVYSILSREDMTDKQLQQKLKVNAKTLFYYRQNMMRYNILKEFELPNKEE
ncbi:site-specific integrase [Lactobacillus xujianguonis]|uniref:site-specific integrase n=1 Tax=Lactobacillus xujianguonis TaxID=2495899 RepID=UPI000FDAF85C|nr:site-specific integrase [Lactobacillus xujianguonis]RVU76852.1 integrase [Lactobacillus xujianguonis]